MKFQLNQIVKVNNMVGKVVSHKRDLLLRNKYLVFINEYNKIWVNEKELEAL